MNNRTFILTIAMNLLLGALCVLWSIPETDMILCAIGLAIIVYQLRRIAIRDEKYYLRGER